MSGEIKKRNTKSTKSKKSDGSLTEQKSGDVKSKLTVGDKVSKKKNDDSTSPDPPPKFGPMPKLSPHRLWSRTALILGLMTIVWYNSGKKNESPLAKIDEDIRFKGMKTKCSSGFDQSVAKFKPCVPNHCGRVITDEIVTPQEIHAVNDLVTRVFKEAKQDAAATIFDLTSGTLNFNGKSVDLISGNKTKPIFEDGDLLIFQSVKSKLMRMVSSYFGVDYWSIFLAAPTYVTKLTEMAPKAKEDEYWHITVNKDFQYSTILFLSDFGKDFEAGRLVFMDGDQTNRTVDGKKGRAIAFTSGEENKHFHERVTRGARYALTVGFTCDSKKAKKDPKL